jgi:predicted  nucleic acid-binding Zn-ribbon protein
VRRTTVERRLRDNSRRLQRLRDQLGEEAEDARIRAAVSETSLAQREHHDAERHAAAMSRHRAEVQAEIERLERDQDALLDQLSAS